MKSNSESKDTVVGFLLALVLTAVPFLAVLYKLGSREAITAVIAASAIVQILVHLRFFLGIRLRKSAPENLYPLLFAVVLLVIMVGGTLWVMANMSYRMGH
ncbi:MAG: cytochrome o ubiquinol oxidase subunit IV [Paracoccaceae bacterium]